MNPSEYMVDISETLDWKLEQGQTLRQALEVEARKDLGVEGEIEIVIEDGAFVGRAVE